MTDRLAPLAKLADEFENFKFINEGSFGKVYSAIDKETKA